MKNWLAAIGGMLLIGFVICLIVWQIAITINCSRDGGETLRNIWNWPVCIGAER